MLVRGPIMVFGGAVSFFVLVGRAITRITSTGTTAGLANPFISLCEDAVVVVLAIVCFAVGTIAVLVAVSLIIFAIWVL